jgi:hypothetical protein
VKTNYDTENQIFEIQKPKPNRTTEKTEISVRFGTVRFSVYGKKVPIPTSSSNPRLLRRRWRWCLGGDSGRVLSKKRRQSPSPACCPVPTKSFVKLRQQFCGSGRRLRLSTSASTTGAPNWRSAPSRRPDNSPPSGPNSSGTARSTRRTSRRCMPGSWRRTRGKRRWPGGRRPSPRGRPSQQNTRSSRSRLWRGCNSGSRSLRARPATLPLPRRTLRQRSSPWTGGRRTSPGERRISPSEKKCSPGEASCWLSMSSRQRKKKGSWRSRSVQCGVGGAGSPGGGGHQEGP